MFDLNKLVRKNIAKLQPYSCARDEFGKEAKVFLDANENSLGSVTNLIHNRYPDPKQKALKALISKVKNISIDSIFVGNGSDEAIDLIMRIFCEPSKDSILICSPTYGMYKVTADINDINVVDVPLMDDFSLNISTINFKLKEGVKLLFICSPNNPTGNAFPLDEIQTLCQECAKNNTLLIVDEAYSDFCEEKSILPFLDKYPNLIVLQTLSKAWGLAEIRVGLAFASADIISFLSKVKPPYNVSGVSQKIAIEALSKATIKNSLVSELIKQRDSLVSELEKLPGVIKVYPSDANFILIKLDNAKKIFESLCLSEVIVRDRSSVLLCENCLRITVGSQQENEALLSVLKDRTIKDIACRSVKNSGETILLRTSKVSRRTKETDIEIELNLDGTGEALINTGLGFFDHMLSQIAKHGLIDLRINCKGDLHVDEHHTIEDTALALGEAILAALGDKRGIERYGFLLPMDDCLAQVAIDFSGRSWLEWFCEFKREKVGDMPTEMFKHFFKSFCDTAKCNLSIRAEGENEHHKIESIFKAFAKAISNACRKGNTPNLIPSTKGVL
jgi:histidinol-phosphate aminotransferase